MTVWLTSDLHFGHPFVAGIRAGHASPDRSAKTTSVPSRMGWAGRSREGGLT